MKRVIVLVPCFNEEKNIEKVINRMTEWKASNAYTKSCFTLDYIILNDCSKDSTLSLCIEKGLNYITIPINLGIGGCIQTGYKYALDKGYDIAIQHDGDGQHDPSYFTDVIMPIESGEADIIIGSRYINNEGFQSTILRRIGIIILSKLIYWCSSVKIFDVTSGYRAVNRDYIKIFASHYAQDYPEPESILYAALRKARIREVPVKMHERMEGTSSINSLKPLYYMIKVSLSILLYRFVMARKE